MTYVDCGECPRISTGCKDRCSKAEAARLRAAPAAQEDAAKSDPERAKIERSAGYWRALTVAIATRGASLVSRDETPPRAWMPRVIWECTVGKSTVLRGSPESALHCALHLEFDGNVPESFGLPESTMSRLVPSDARASLSQSAAQGAGDERAIWAALEQSERDAYLTLKDRYPDDLAGLCCAGIAELSKVFGQRLAALAQPAGQPEPTEYDETKKPIVKRVRKPAEQAQGVSDAGWLAETHVAIKVFHTHDFGAGPVLHPDCISDALRKGMQRALSHSPAPASTARVVDPTDPGYDVEVLRNHVRALERRIRELHRAAPASPPVPQVPELMSDAKLREIALQAAWRSSSDKDAPKYLPRSTVEASVFRAHDWVILAMRDAIKHSRAQWLAALGRQA